MRRRALIQLAFAVSLLIAVLGAYALWYLAVGQASLKAAELGEEIRALESSRASAREIQEVLGTLEGDEAAMREYLVREEEIVPFLDELERTGAALGSVVTVASVSEERGTGRDRILLSLSIAGSFDSVLRTLGAIEYGPYDSVVTSMTLDSAAGTETPGRWTATATFALGTRQAP